MSSDGVDSVLAGDNTTLDSTDIVGGSSENSPTEQDQTLTRTRSGRVPKPNHDPEFVYQRP